MSELINSPYNKYKQSAVQTSTPAQLVVMLYDGAIRFIKTALQGLQQHDHEKTSTNLGKAQSIVSELMGTLNFDYEISKNLYSLYEYTNYLLIESNIRKDHQKIEEALSYLIELRETWVQANKLALGQTETANG
ncbi:flagellar export chaperone FliS [Paenibacillus sp. UASWS1643]|uniref:flagellar export chaperone FliS n=1 Tax=Paenibacillus sp. UASWS1643 TaxID=2580422 RepID=UPI00295AEE3F|nr:flagellar export chaperone FliS [Paenibacillus sp. UASWS1643]